MADDVVVIGAGGFGSEVAAMLGESGYSFAGYLDRDTQKKGVLGDDRLLPRLETDSIACRVVVAIGDPRERCRLSQIALGFGLDLVNLVHPHASVAADITIGRGVVIYPQAVVMPGCSLGNGSVVNAGATLGHDGVLGDFAMVSPGVNLAGWVKVGSHAVVGIGSSVREHISIGCGAVVGAGSVVVQDVQPGTTVFGVPAKPR